MPASSPNGLVPIVGDQVYVGDDVNPTTIETDDQLKLVGRAWMHADGAWRSPARDRQHARELAADAEARQAAHDAAEAAREAAATEA